MVLIGLGPAESKNADGLSSLSFLYCHFRYPKSVEALLGKRVVDVAIGPKHVIVATEDNLMFGWGSNEHGQLGSAFSMAVKTPTLLCSLKGKVLSGEQR